MSVTIVPAIRVLAGPMAAPTSAAAPSIASLAGAKLMILSGLGMLALGAASVPERPALHGTLAVNVEARP